MNKEEETKIVSDKLAIVSGLDIRNDENVNLIRLAIMYADISNYTSEPKSVKDYISNDIFSVKAISFLRRKIIQLKRKTAYFTREDSEHVIFIKEWEYDNISKLESKLEYL